MGIKPGPKRREIGDGSDDPLLNIINKRIAAMGWCTRMSETSLCDKGISPLVSVRTKPGD